MKTYPKFRVAAAHVAPVFLDTPATVDKACAMVEEAARHGAQLVAFPESYIPAFPVWLALQAPIHNHALFQELAANAILCPGPELARISSAARRHGVFVSMGFTEGTTASVGCLWNSNVLIGDDGAVLNHHRKIVPTFFEKLAWANGDGAGLKVADTSIGRIGVLICGENTNPLARFTLMAQGEQVHVSTYPPVWPTRDPRGGGNYDLRNAIHIRAGAHAFEAKAFNVVVSGFMDQPMFERLAALNPDAGDILKMSPRGVSLVIGPTGDVISDELSDREDLLYTDIDVARCVEPKQFHDLVGYYNRFDIFDLRVNCSANRPVVFTARQGRDGAPTEEDLPRTDDPRSA
jgi:aliphatic nitrilase